MAKLLRTRDLLLLGLSGILDVYEEIRDPLQLVSKSYENMYGFVPKNYKRSNFNHLVWRSLKTGYIEKVEKDGDLYLRLTSQGQKKIVRDFPLLAVQQKSWDRKWRVVIFDIEEVQKHTRDSLRRKLKELGFGLLQKSVFISPHAVAQDLSEFIAYIGLSDAAYVLETSKIVVGDERELANKVWNLDEINSMYGELIKRIESDYLNHKRDRVDRLNTEKVTAIKQTYLAILLQDPFLPRELLPSDWNREKVKKLIKNL